MHDAQGHETAADAKPSPEELKRLSEELAAAWALLPQLADLPAFREQYPSRGNAVYTTPVVLWMLLWQRMSPDSTLEAALKNLIQTRPSLLPEPPFL